MSAGINVLVVEDDAPLRADLTDYLSMRGFNVRSAGAASEFHAMMKDAHPDVVILDVELPDGNGFELAETIRQGPDCGVIMLTAHGATESRIRGFDSGADIYLVKHSTLREIEAAVRSVFRRLAPATAAAPEAWVLDSRSWTITEPEGGVIPLTATELTFLTLLIRAAGEPCSRQDLSAAMTRPQTTFDDRHLDAVVSRLRRKLEAASTGAPSPIRSAYGYGYAFGAPARIRGS